MTVFWRTGRLGVFSLGYDDLSHALAGDLGWQLAVLLLVSKFVATFTCYGFGGMIGIAAAGLISLQWPVVRADAIALAVVGMSACLGAVVGAPVTGILIVFEMTHEFSLVPALMLGALVSQAVSRKLNPENFYEALLTQDGHRIEHVRPPRDLRSWHQLPVSVIANFQPVVLKTLESTEIRQVLEAHPYERFPVPDQGRLSGMLTRKAAAAALAQKRPPQLEPATLCLPTQTIREVQGS